MSDLDSQLDKLFKAASRAPRETSCELPYGFETRVLAAWAASPAEEISLLAFFQRALLACLAVMALTLAYSYGNWNNTVSSNPLYAMTDSAVDSAVDISLP